MGATGNPEVLREAPSATAAGEVVRVAGTVATTGGGAVAVNSASVTQVPVDMAAVTVLAANANRNGYRIQADYANPNAVYVKEGTAAAANSKTATLQPGGAMGQESQVNYKGIITAIGVAAGNLLDVTEY